MSKYVDCVSVQRQKDRLVLGGVRGCHLPPKSERDMGVERSVGALGGEGGGDGVKEGCHWLLVTPSPHTTIVRNLRACFLSSSSRLASQNTSMMEHESIFLPCNRI